MKRLAALITTLGVLAVPISTHASTGMWHRCQTTAPGFVQYLYASGVGCRTARTVERYWVTHEILHPVTIAGIHWNYQHRNYSNSADTWFRSGNLGVSMVSRPSN